MNRTRKTAALFTFFLVLLSSSLFAHPEDGPATCDAQILDCIATNISNRASIWVYDVLLPNSAGFIFSNFMIFFLEALEKNQDISKNTFRAGHVISLISMFNHVLAIFHFEFMSESIWTRIVKAPVRAGNILFGFIQNEEVYNFNLS